MWWPFKKRKPEPEPGHILVIYGTPYTVLGKTNRGLLVGRWSKNLGMTRVVRVSADYVDPHEANGRIWYLRGKGELAGYITPQGDKFSRVDHG